MDDLEQLLPQSRIIKTKDGGDIEVSPFKVKKLRQVLAALEGIEFDMNGGAAQIRSLLSGDKADKVFAAIGLSIGKEPSWVEDTLYPGEVLELAVTLVEVNASFFVGGGLKRVLEAKDRVLASITSLGVNSQPASPSLDTHSANS